MQTLSYGFFKPQNPDTGDVWFAAMEDNIQQLNDHDHDGSNSSPLATTLATAAAGSWVASGSAGMYRQAVSVPAGMSYDSCDIWVHRSTGEVVYPTLEKISTTQFYIYTNDNSLAYTLFFR